MKNYHFLFCLICLAASVSQAQNVGSKTAEGIYVSVELMPEFPGGEEALMKFLSDKIKYPKAEKKQNHSGTVYIQFVVNAIGKVTDCKVVKGIPNAAGLDEEALRVVKSMPDWKPGTMSGKEVPVQFTLPINFVLNH